MSVIDDTHTRHCQDCGEHHEEHVMNACNGRCKGWTCKPFALDPYNEICDDCHEEAEQSRSEHAFERELSR